MQHTDWDDLGQPVRDLIQAQTGPVHGARTVTAGLNSQLAVVLDAADGQVFVKGLRAELMFCAASIAGSRILLGMHFLSDVVAGGLLGAGLGYASVLLYRLA